MNDMSVSELRQALREKGLTSRGSRKQLLSRLQEVYTGSTTISDPNAPTSNVKYRITLGIPNTNLQCMVLIAPSSGNKCLQQLLDKATNKFRVKAKRIFDASNGNEVNAHNILSILSDGLKLVVTNGIDYLPLLSTHSPTNSPLIPNHTLMKDSGQDKSHDIFDLNNQNDDTAMSLKNFDQDKLDTVSDLVLKSSTTSLSSAFVQSAATVPGFLFDKNDKSLLVARSITSSTTSAASSSPEPANSITPISTCRPTLPDSTIAEISVTPRPPSPSSSISSFSSSITSAHHAANSSAAHSTISASEIPHSSSSSHHYAKREIKQLQAELKQSQKREEKMQSSLSSLSSQVSILADFQKKFIDSEASLLISLKNNERLIRERDKLQNKCNKLQEQTQRDKDITKNYEIVNREKDNALKEIEKMKGGITSQTLDTKELEQLLTFHSTAINNISNELTIRQTKMTEQLRVMTKQIIESKKCQICYNNECDVLVSPCQHCAMCSVCCVQVKHCPFCRTFINDRMPVRFLT